MKLFKLVFPSSLSGRRPKQDEVEITLEIGEVSEADARAFAATVSLEDWPVARDITPEVWLDPNQSSCRKTTGSQKRGVISKQVKVYP